MWDPEPAGRLTACPDLYRFCCTFTVTYVHLSSTLFHIPVWNNTFLPSLFLSVGLCLNIVTLVVLWGPPLWSSGQSFWLQIQRSRVRSPALPDFLSSSGSRMGSTQPREVKLRSYLNKKSSGSRFRKQRLTAVGTRCANHVTPLYPQKFALTSPTGGGRSVGMVRSQTKATEFRLVSKTM